MEVVHIDYVQAADYVGLGLTASQLHAMLEKMMEIRLFEERIEELFLVEGKLIGPSHLYLGQEAVAVGVFSALRDDDLLLTTYRCHGHALAKNVPAKSLMAELFGKETGTCKGLGGSMHASIHMPVGSVYATAIVGSGIPIAAGVALALKESGADKLATVFFGDGAVNTGAFHEGLNVAAVWKVPLLLVCENNGYAMSTRIETTLASPSIAERCASYGVPSLVVNGNSVLSVHKAVKMVSEGIRTGKGPAVLECRTYKMKGHGVYDKGDYRPEAEVRKWQPKDPIKTFSAELLDLGLMTAGDMDDMRQGLEAEIDEAVRYAASGSVLPFDELNKYLYA